MDIKELSIDLYDLLKNNKEKSFGIATLMRILGATTAEIRMALKEWESDSRIRQGNIRYIQYIDLPDVPARYFPPFKELVPDMRHYARCRELYPEGHNFSVLGAKSD